MKDENLTDQLSKSKLNAYRGRVMANLMNAAGTVMKVVGPGLLQTFLDRAVDFADVYYIGSTDSSS